MTGNIVYVAAPWIDKEGARKASDLLEAKGYKISEKWWFHEETTDPLKLEQQALKDLHGVLNCDILFLINSSKSEGKAAESGIALSTGKAMILVGDRTNIFHYLEVWDQFPDIETAVAALGKV